jgi:hypothetical protein
MKTSSLLFITVFVFSNLTYSQKEFSGFYDRSRLDRYYLKAGIDFSSVSNEKLQTNKITWSDIWGSVAYDYSSNVQLEFLYRYIGHRFYDIAQVDIRNYPYYYNYDKFDDYFSHNFNLKANYFFRKDKTVNPFYLTGSLVFALQRVTNNEITNEGKLTTQNEKGYFSSNIHVISFYDRVMIGPELGAGMFLAFGHVNFQVECSFSAKVAPFVNRGFKEYAFNISLAPVYNF